MLQQLIIIHEAVTAVRHGAMNMHNITLGHGRHAPLIRIILMAQCMQSSTVKYFKLITLNAVCSKVDNDITHNLYTITYVNIVYSQHADK